MLDGFGRNIHYLRVSITDRCNLRCIYCMPQEGVAWVDHSLILSYEELLRLCRLFAELGVDKVRLTGGEPLVRRDLAALVHGIKALPGIQTVTLTTNGVLLREQLPALLDAGLDGVNLSLDTLDRTLFSRITRRDELDRALEGLHAALAAPDLNVKLNCVPMGENDDQLVPLAALARDHNLSVRFIELMPIGLGGSLPRRTEEEVRAVLGYSFGPARPCPQAEGAGPGRYVTFSGFRGRVGFISAMTHQFCGQCNRVRLTSGGFLKTCLQFDSGIDLRALLQCGTSDAQVKSAIEHAIAAKPACHHFSVGKGTGDEGRNMNQIGG